ncbi:MAG: PHP domain-containing protein [Erysipelotrichaceae bacterium]|nr:PHP domain-containing protein [Erysipelotrichaceae bacterium]
MSNYIDLHMHSLYSDDGEFTPTSLVEQCEAAGVSIMAIADHNWVKAIDEAKAVAATKGIRYIPAIEIDCVYKGINLHVLGYGIDYSNPAFNQLGQDIMDQELKLSLKKIDMTNDYFGVELSKEQLDAISPNGVYVGEAFAEALLNDPRYDNLEALKPYRAGGARSDNPYVNFYWDFYSQGKPIYTEVIFPSMEETIKLINDNGGVAVLAHPGNNLKGQFEVFDEMVAKGMQGVEAFSSYHSVETNHYFYNKAKEYDLLYTCGSDFHGKTKPAIFLGENGCDIDPKDIEEKLKAYHLI